MDISNRLLNLRKEMGVSQHRLSQLSGVSQSYLSYLEAGKKSPTVKTLKKICAGLGISIADFFGSNNEELLDSATRAILAEIEKLDEKQKKSLRFFLSSF